MSWYNPVSWFYSKYDQKIKLICDNPTCSDEIRERDVIYDRKRDKVYHDVGCAGIGTAFLSLELNEHIHATTEHISKKRVVNIRKSKGLENHISEDNSVITK
jgi:hypothetical protein